MNGKHLRPAVSSCTDDLYVPTSTDGFLFRCTGTLLRCTCLIEIKYSFSILAFVCVKFFRKLRPFPIQLAVIVTSGRTL